MRVSFVIIDGVFAYLSFLFLQYGTFCDLSDDYSVDFLTISCFGVAVTFRPHVGLFDLSFF